ncbi:MAG: hypothetical protein CME63_15195 [Halobacteriovoraceae bacterium]|nr:hypothetical protein [Halobacteriovoraceae bacterium]|tara:strand:+ start:142849 stop:143406 length:558 start_codon:yes stop_codon:yes gene_type:complete
MKWLKFKILILIILMLQVEAKADGIYFGGGFYSLSAEVGNKSTSLSNPSAYSLSYTKSFFPQISFEIGYSFLFESLIGGDMSYGPQIGVRYYHYGTSTNSTASLEGLSIHEVKSYNPYLSAGFSQKEFQSIKSSYSGFYLGGGVEMGWKKNLSLFSDFKYSQLSGPVQGKANELTIIVGIIYHDF